MKNLIIRCLLLLSASFGFGCSQGNSSGEVLDEQIAESITLRINILGTPSASRSSGLSPARSEENTIPKEAEIHNACILLFIPDGQVDPEDHSSIPGHLWKTAVADNIKFLPGGGWMLESRFKVDPDSAPNSLVGVVLANTVGLLPPENLISDTHYSRLAASISTSIDQIGVSGFIPMWGILDSPVLIDKSAQDAGVRLIRSVAKASVRMGDDIPFVLESVGLYKGMTEVALLPALEAGSSKPVLPALPADASISSAVSSCLDGFADAGSISIFLAEQDITSGSKSLTPDAPDRCSRPALIVGLKNSLTSETTHFYRLDFSDGEFLTDVVRNHHYGFKISKVENSGCDSPEEAYFSAASSISAEVLDWELSDQEIIWEGPHWLSLEAKNVFLPGTAGQVVSLHLASDVNADDWQMKWEGDADFSVSQEVACDIFSVSRPEGDVADGAWLRFSTLAELDSDEMPRSRILTIKINSSLQTEIAVTQNPGQGIDWYAVDDIISDL